MISKRVVFIGSKRIGLQVLKCLCKVAGKMLVGCITLDDRNDTRSVLNEIKSYVIENEIPLAVISINEKKELEKAISEFSPDICFVVGWYRLISKELLQSVRYGFIGVHNSLLPAYRGSAPVVWAMINGEKEVGYSVFSFDEGMDTGDIWFQESVPIYHTDYIEDVLNRIEKRVFIYFKNNVEQILCDDIKPIRQVNHGISYGAKRGEKDGHIKWEWDAKRIYDFVRAQSHPYPGAYTFIKKEKYRIWEVKVFDHKVYGECGQILMLNKTQGWIVVVCGNSTAVRIELLDSDGVMKKAAEVLLSLEDRLE